MPGTFTVQRSSIDEERFGVRTARAFVSERAEAERAVAACAADGTELLIVRCPATALAAVHYLEARGARLMDVLVYFERVLDAAEPASGRSEVEVRRARAEDAAALAAIARGAFAGYGGHYHADPRLDRSACDEAYVSWATRSLEARVPGTEVLVAELAGSPAGFVTVRLNEGGEAEIVLNAVARPQQRRGVNRSLLLGALAWARKRGAARMIVSSQVSNIAAQRAWCRVGFEPAWSLYTLHWWRASAEAGE